MVSVEGLFMRDMIWGFGDLDTVEDAELTELFGNYVLVEKIVEINGVSTVHSKRMPSALAVEEVLRSPTNGVFVKSAKIIGMTGKFDMSMSAPYWNPWSQSVPDDEEDIEQ